MIDGNKPASVIKFLLLSHPHYVSKENGILGDSIKHVGLIEKVLCQYQNTICIDFNLIHQAPDDFDIRKSIFGTKPGHIT